MNIDRRISYKLVIDTETCPLDPTVDGVDPLNMWVYDCGFAVVDKRGKVYESWSYINGDIFNFERELMASAYYAWKLPRYAEDIMNGSRIIESWFNIKRKVWDLIEKYEIEEVYAHNMRFDLFTLNNTERWVTKSKFRYFFPYDVKICDTMKMANTVICAMPTYKKFCIENGYTTKTGRPRKTAEILYKFISKDLGFEESHTGLEDVLIEKEIMAYCFRQHKPMERLLFNEKPFPGFTCGDCPHNCENCPWA